jgi:hypothetical protein
MDDCEVKQVLQGKERERIVFHKKLKINIVFLCIVGWLVTNVSCLNEK